jgi:hypothetical protein
LLHGFVLWLMVQRLPLMLDIDAREIRFSCHCSSVAAC